MNPEDTNDSASGRIGSVTLSERFQNGSPDLSQTPDRLAASERLEYGRKVAQELAAGSPFLDEKRLNRLLEQCLAETSLDGLLIGTRDGLTVAQVAHAGASEILPVIGSLVEDMATRAEREHVVGTMDEIVLRGAQEELVVVRYFPETGRRFFLLAHARQRCTYRRGTNRIVRECGPLLAACTDV